MALAQSAQRALSTAFVPKQKGHAMKPNVGQVSEGGSTVAELDGAVQKKGVMSQLSL